MNMFLASTCNQKKVICPTMDTERHDIDRCALQYQIKRPIGIGGHMSNIARRRPRTY